MNLDGKQWGVGLAGWGRGVFHTERLSSVPCPMGPSISSSRPLSLSYHALPVLGAPQV